MEIRGHLGFIGISVKATVQSSLRKHTDIFIKPFLRAQNNPSAFLQIGSKEAYLDPETKVTLGQRGNIRINDSNIALTHLTILYDGNDKSGFSLSVQTQDKEVRISSSSGEPTIATSENSLEGCPLQDGDTITLFLSGHQADGQRETIEILFHTIKTAISKTAIVRQEQAPAPIWHQHNPELRQLAYDLADGLFPRRRAKRELLERNTPEAWGILLKDARFCKILVKSKAEKLLLRILELAGSGQAEAKSCLNGLIPGLSAEYIEQLHRQGNLQPLLEVLDNDAIFALGNRSDLKYDEDHLSDSFDAVFSRLMDLAKEDTEVKEYLERRILEMSQQQLDHLAKFEVLSRILEVISPEALINLAPKTMGYNPNNLKDSADLVELKVLALAETGNASAVAYFEREMPTWTEEYLNHLAKFEVLSRILEVISPEALINLAPKTMGYNPDNLKGAADLVELKVLALAETGDTNAIAALERDLPTWTEEYLAHLAKFEVLSRILEVISSEALINLAPKTMGYNPDNLKGAADLVKLKVLELAETGNASAVAYFERKMPTWTEEYLNHLAKFEVLPRILELISPEALFSILLATNTSFNTDNLKDSADLVELKVLALAETGNASAVAYFEREMPILTEEYLNHLAKFEVLSRILEVISPEALINLAPKTMGYNPNNLKGAADLVELKVLALAETGDTNAIAALERDLPTYSTEYLAHLAKFGILPRIQAVISRQASVVEEEAVVVVESKGRRA